MRQHLVLSHSRPWLSCWGKFGLYRPLPTVRALSRLEMEFAAKLRQSLPQNMTGWENVGKPTSLLDPYDMSIKTVESRAIFKVEIQCSSLQGWPSLHTIHSHFVLYQSIDWTFLLMRFTFGLDLGRLESHWQTEQH